MKTIKLQCHYCKNYFDKDLREYNRQIKANKNRFYCNLSCVSSQRNIDFPSKGYPQFLIPNNKRDEYTPFRYYVLKGNYRNKTKNYGCNITVEYLKNLWDSQNGICPFTGWNLILPNNTKNMWDKPNPANASLDRIDNSKGYVEGNVRFIAVIANYARNNFTDDQLIDFCRSVIKNKNI